MFLLWMKDNIWQECKVTQNWVPLDYLYGRRNLETFDRSSFINDLGNISFDSCAVYLK